MGGDGGGIALFRVPFWGLSFIGGVDLMRRGREGGRRKGKRGRGVRCVSREWWLMGGGRGGGTAWRGRSKREPN